MPDTPSLTPAPTPTPCSNLRWHCPACGRAAPIDDILHVLRTLPGPGEHHIPTDLVTLKEASLRSKIPVRTLYHWVRSATITSYGRPAHILLSLSDVIPRRGPTRRVSQIRHTT